MTKKEFAHFMMERLEKAVLKYEEESEIYVCTAKTKEEAQKARDGGIYQMAIVTDLEFLLSNMGYAVESRECIRQTRKKAHEERYKAEWKSMRRNAQ